MNDFALTAPEPHETRFTPFKELIWRAYIWRYQKECPWGPAESNQLARVLRESPELTATEFAHWLKNYLLSQDHPPGERPSHFLPRIHNYAIEPLDRFSRGQNATSKTFTQQSVSGTEQSAREFLNKKRNRSNIPAESSTSISLPPRINDRGLRALGPFNGAVLNSGD